MVEVIYSIRFGMMIIPIKVKYLGYLDWVIFAAAILFQPFTGKVAAVLALASISAMVRGPPL